VFSFRTTTLSLGLVKSKSSFHRDPLLRNGQLLCFPFGQRPSPWDWSSPYPPYIKALSDGMVIDFFLYIKALSDGMVIDFFLYIKALSDGMVIDFFLYIKALSDGMDIVFFLYIKTLSDRMVIDFFLYIKTLSN